MTKGSIKKILNQEIVHFYDGINIISSKHLRVRFKRDKQTFDNYKSLID